MMANWKILKFEINFLFYKDNFCSKKRQIELLSDQNLYAHAQKFIF